MKEEDNKEEIFEEEDDFEDYYEDETSEKKDSEEKEDKKEIKTKTTKKKSKKKAKEEDKEEIKIKSSFEDDSDEVMGKKSSLMKYASVFILGVLLTVGFLYIVGFGNNCPTCPTCEGAVGLDCPEQEPCPVSDDCPKITTERCQALFGESSE